MMVDVHVRSKMIVETAQILSNCFSLKKLEEAPKSQIGNFRKHSYPKHPCCLWVRQGIDNFRWTIAHGIALALEREYRWPGSPYHFSLNFIKWCETSSPDRITSENLGLTKPALAFGKEWEHLKTADPVESYRAYYNVAKRQNIKMSWTRREQPYWYE